MFKTSKKALIERWKTNEGKANREKVIKCFLDNRPIEELPFMEIVNGHLDLRGITFENLTVFTKMQISNVDFSYSDFGCWLLKECKFENVIFEMCDCTEMAQYECQFKDCKFIKSKFITAGFGIRGGKYINILFEECNFKDSHFYNPDFIDCIFKNCKLNKVDFNASHFTNVKFIGKLDDVWFRGENWRDNERKKLQEMGWGLNPMIIDFSEAELHNLTISNRCDLSRVIMPNDEKHFLIKNFIKTIKYLKIKVSTVKDQNRRKFIELFIKMYERGYEQDFLILNIDDMVDDAKYCMGTEGKEYGVFFTNALLEISKDSNGKEVKL